MRGKALRLAVKSKVFVITYDGDSLGGALKMMSPGSQSSDNS